MEDDGAAVLAGAGANVDEVVGGLHDGLLVLDDDQGVSLIAEAVHDADEAVDVSRVQADGGLVEDEERAGQGGAEAGGEVDALDLAAGKGAGLAVEGKVAQPHLFEVEEAGNDFC